MPLRYLAAARLVEDFLGRSFSFDAWRNWLETGS
jgi:hypothetical protein